MRLSDELREQLKADAKRDEGLRLFPYRDIVDRVTIGYGRNLDDRGITEATANQMLDEDVELAFLTARKLFPDLEHYTVPRQLAIANMALNLGENRLRGFRAMIAAIKAGDWLTASREALTSKWARQVGKRAERIAEMLKDG